MRQTYLDHRQILLRFDHDVSMGVHDTPRHEREKPLLLLPLQELKEMELASVLPKYTFPIDPAHHQMIVPSGALLTCLSGHNHHLASILPFMPVKQNKN